MVTVILGFLLIIFLLCYVIYRYSEKILLSKQVSWCAADDPKVQGLFGLVSDLGNVAYLSRTREPGGYSFPHAKYLFTIDEKYSINDGEEEKIAKEILAQYQQDLAQKYFSGCLCASNVSRKLTYNEFFLYTLKTFLQSHKDKDTFNGCEMYKFISRDPQRREITYEITDYAVVYLKMYYIAQIYCLTLRKHPLREGGLEYILSQYTKEALDTKIMKSSF